MLTHKASSGQLNSAEAKACTLSITTPTVFGLQTPPDLKTTLSEVVAVKALFLHHHDDSQTLALEAAPNFSFTNRSGSKRQLVLSLLIPFSCIEARRHRVWSRAFIHEGSCFLTEKNKF